MLSVLLLVACGLNVIGCNTRTPPASPTRPAFPSTQVDADPRAMLEGIVARESLVLSTAPDSASTRFSCSVKLLVPMNGTMAAAKYELIRDGDRVAVLVRSLDGRAYAYATSGLLVGVDPANVKSLVGFLTGAPVFRLSVESGATDKLDMAFAHFRRLDKADVFVDLSSLIRASLKNCQLVQFDSTTRSIQMKTDKADVWVTTASDQRTNAFSISRFLMKGKGGTLIELSEVRLGDQVKELRPLDAVRLEQLAVPLRTPGPADGETSPLLVPGRLGETPDERVAAEQLERALAR